MATASAEEATVQDLPPKLISFDSIVVDVACHPERDMIAAADIDGNISIYSYSQRESNHELMTLGHHKKACRAVRFNVDGTRLVSISKDKSLQVVDMTSGAVTQAIKKAHDHPIYSLLLVDENIIATGDDDGRLKVWDLRHNAAVMDVRENDDFISDMIVGSSKRTLVATSGEGVLTAYDIRRHKMTVQSELFESGLLSLAVVKNSTKVVCGTEDGVLNIFNWDEWGNISDRIPVDTISIDSIVPVTEDIICIGADDGKIRALSILPNRVLGVVGDHGEDAVENMCKSRCGRWLVSCGHDQKVKFWDLEDVKTEKVDASRKAKKAKTLKPLSSTATRNDFFADFAAADDQVPEGSGDAAAVTEKPDCSDDSNSDDSGESDDEALGDEVQEAESGSDSDESDDS